MQYGGPSGQKIEEAVAGDPRAEEYILRYKAGTSTGLTLAWAGILTSLGGAVVVLADIGENPNQQSLSTASTAGFALAGVGLVVELIGVLVNVNAKAHLFDAVNAFNDGLDAGRTSAGE